MAPFARITSLHHVAVADCSPCARFLYEYLLIARPAGAPIEFICEDFQEYIAAFRKRGAFCLKWVKNALQELIAIDLVQVVRKLGPHAFKLVAYHPPNSFENKTSPFEKKTSTIGQKTSKKGASNPHAAVPYYRDIEQHTYPPILPVVALNNESGPEELAKDGPLLDEMEDKSPPMAVSDPPVEDLPPPADEVLSREQRELLKEAATAVSPAPLNPHLRSVVLRHSVQLVRDALAAVKEQLAKGGVRNPGGLLVTAIQQRWQPAETPYRGSTFPDELLDWYPRAVAAGFVLNYELRMLPTMSGQTQVKVPDPRGRDPYLLRPWREAMAEFPC